MRKQFHSLKSLFILKGMPLIVQEWRFQQQQFQFDIDFSFSLIATLILSVWILISFITLAIRTVKMARNKQSDRITPDVSHNAKTLFGK